MVCFVWKRVKIIWKELAVSQDMNSCNLNPESKPLTVAATWSPPWRLGPGSVQGKGRHLHARGGGGEERSFHIHTQGSIFMIACNI